MSLLKDLTSFVSGGLFGEIKDVAKTWWPPEMSEQDKADREFQLQQFLDAKQQRLENLLGQASTQLDKRIAEQEGTAKDLKTIPVLGHLIIFLRGVQRPLWGYATLYMDYRWFFEVHNFTEQQQTAMIVINLLVLGFLFGERTIKNLEPLIIKVFGKEN